MQHREAILRLPSASGCSPTGSPPILPAMFHDLKLLETDAGLDFEIHLDPDKRFYCFFGENGVGKTNLLQNLTRTMLAMHSILLPASVGDYRFKNAISGRLSFKALGSRSLVLPKRIEIEGTQILRWKDRRVLPADLRRDDFPMIGSLTEMPWAQWIIDKPVVMIGTKARGHTINIKADKLEFIGDIEKELERAFHRTWNAATGHTIKIPVLAHWIASRRLINPSFVIGASSRANEVTALCELLSELDPALRISADSINFRDGKLWFLAVPLDKLATGYIAVIRIFQEIIAAYGAWGGLIDASDIRSFDGIVLIDELEAHLHPKWQIGLVSLLKRAFPNTTFIVCTHSPLVVAQTEEGEAYELIREGNSVSSRRLGNPRDWYLADVYANAFHIALPPPGSDAPEGETPLTDLLIEFSAHVKDFLANRTPAKRTEALGLYERIRARIPEDDPRRKSLDSLRSLVG